MGITEENVMNPLNKDKNGILTRLIFVTSVLATLVFAVSPVSAQVCVEGNFCDRDGDTFIRDHKKCDSCGGTIDCDDAVSDPANDCESGDTPSTVYTAELTAGAFIFIDAITEQPISIDVSPNSRNNALTSVHDAEMRRPATSGDARDTWDRMFEVGCPLLVTASGDIDQIVSGADDWSFENAGDRRLILRDIPLTDLNGVAWDVTVQLIGKENDPNVDDFLPTDGEMSTFTLIRGAMWGQTVSGGPGGRTSCQPKGSGGFDIFELSLTGYDSILEIVNP